MFMFMALSLSLSNAPHVEDGFLPGAVAAQCAFFTNRVRPLEDPVLPRGQTPKNLGFHRLRAGKAQVRLHAGHGVGREARAFLQEDAQLFIPVEVLVGRSDDAELGRLRAFDRLADFSFERAERFYVVDRI